MTLDISSILTDNTLLGLNLGCTLKQAFKRLDELELLYYYQKNSSDDSFIIVESLQLFFKSGNLDFGGIPMIYSGASISLFGHKFNERTTLKEFHEILSMHQLTFIEMEVSSNYQFDLVIEDKVGIIFSYEEEEKQYRLNKIQWGGPFLIQSKNFMPD